MKFFIFGLAWVMVFGCNWLKGATAEPTAETTPNIPPREQIADGPSFVRATYSGNGLAFEYPQGWLVDSFDQLVQVWSTKDQPDGKEFAEGIPAGMTKIEFIAKHRGDPRSVEEIIAAYATDPFGTQVLSSEAVTLPSGIEGYRVVTTGGMMGGELTQYLVTVNGQVWFVTGYGDAAYFDEMMQTLRAG